MEKIINQIIKSNSSLFGNNPSINRINIGFTNTLYNINDLYIVKICTGLNNEEKFKKEISEYKGNSLDLITNAKIYSYLYNKDEETDPLQYGVIIERECPKEIVSKNGDSISLYSMTSLAWKAIQELSDKIKDLEERLWLRNTKRNLKKSAINKNKC